MTRLEHALPNELSYFGSISQERSHQRGILALVSLKEERQCLRAKFTFQIIDRLVKILSDENVKNVVVGLVPVFEELKKIEFNFQNFF